MKRNDFTIVKNEKKRRLDNQENLEQFYVEQTIKFKDVDNYKLAVEIIKEYKFKKKKRALLTESKTMAFSEAHINVNNESDYISEHESEHFNSVTTEDSIEKIRFIQGAIRTNNRAHNLYPKLIYPSENSYQFWQYSKPNLRLKNLSIELLAFASSFMEENTISLSNQQRIIIVTPYTSHYVKERANLKNIIRCSYLLSESAREALEMSSFKSSMSPADRAIQDNQLVCTAPFKVQMDDNYAKININLSKLPPSFLQHCIIKMNDYAVRRFNRSLFITPGVKLTLLKTKEVDKESLYKFETSNTTYTLSIPKENEIFHGINGFKEASIHLLYLIDSLPNEGEGKIIKDSILIYLRLMQTESKLNAYLKKVFTTLFRYMEIDFQRGLPFSPNYVDSIQFLKQDKTLDLKVFFESLRLGKIEECKSYFKLYKSILGTPGFIQIILNEVPKQYSSILSDFLEDHFSEYFIYSQEPLSLDTMSNFELKNYTGQFALKPLIKRQFDLEKIVSQLKNLLEKNQALRKKLIENYAILNSYVLEKTKKLYQNFNDKGGNSKIIEFISTPDLMRLLTGKFKFLIPAILAYEIESQEENSPTFVQNSQSCKTNKTLKITLGSILEHVIKMPLSFIELTPLHEQLQGTEREALLNHIKHRQRINYTYKKLEQSLVDLAKWFLISPSMCEDTIPYDYDEAKINYYSDEIEIICSRIPDDLYDSKKITAEVNNGLHTLLKLLKGDTDIDLNQLVNKFLESTLILNPIISYQLFDNSHFPIALKGEGIHKIYLADNKQVSFSEFILACLKQIANSGLNQRNALIGQQLVLRLQWLEYELEEHSLTRSNSICSM